MSLRTQAAADLKKIVEDDATGFGWSVTLCSPEGQIFALKGLTTDIGVTIDQETGATVAGRRASVVLSLTTLEALDILPRQIASEKLNPWIVTFNDISGEARQYKIVETMPDRAIGALVCILEFYK